MEIRLDEFRASVSEYRQAVATVALVSLADVEVLRADVVSTRRNVSSILAFASSITYSAEAGFLQSGWKDRAAAELLEIETSIKTGIENWDSMSTRVTAAALSKELILRNLPAVTIENKKVVPPGNGNGSVTVPVEDSSQTAAVGSGVSVTCGVLRVHVFTVCVCVLSLCVVCSR